VPGLYLLAILVSFVGAAVIDRRLRLGLWSRATAAAIVAVEVAFLAFDAIGSAGGWFASNPTWVVAIVPPGIPPEEPLLLAFITVWAIVLHRIAGKVTGEDPA
jgi:apolipoprotein N-acyltransferase